MFEPETIEELMYVGIHYEINKQYDLMIKYFLIACEKGHTNAMNCLGDYYESVKNYDEMLKYYLMAIDLGSVVHYVIYVLITVIIKNMMILKNVHYHL